MTQTKTIEDVLSDFRSDVRTELIKQRDALTEGIAKLEASGERFAYLPNYKQALSATIKRLAKIEQAERDIENGK